jgi:hypothetical protein
MGRIEDQTIEAVLELLIADRAGDIGPAFTSIYELAIRVERERCLGAGYVGVGLNARARVRKVSASGRAETMATRIREAVSINRKVDDRCRTTMVMHAAMMALQSRSFSGYWQRGSANHRDDNFGDVFAAVA